MLPDSKDWGCSSRRNGRVFFPSGLKVLSLNLEPYPVVFVFGNDSGGITKKTETIMDMPAIKEHLDHVVDVLDIAINGEDSVGSKTHRTCVWMIPWICTRTNADWHQGMIMVSHCDG